nr:ABC transporter substrate-binding protein [Micromonospora sp. DSM 115978]
EVSWTQFPNMFSYSNYVTAGPASDVWGRFAHGQGATRAVILESTFNSTSHTLARKISESFQAAGIEIAGVIDVTPDALNPVSIPEQIRASGADTLAAALPASAFAGVYVAAVDAGAEIKVARSPTGYDLRLLREHGPDLAGTFYFVDHLPFEISTESHRAFLTAMREYSPHLDPAADHVALTGWIVTDMA